MADYQEKKQYVIAIFNSSKNKYEYATYDNYNGVYSTGYPIFSELCFAKIFNSIGEAETWFGNVKSYLYDLSKHQYDLTSISIIEIVYTQIKTITI